MVLAGLSLLWVFAGFDDATEYQSTGYATAVSLLTTGFGTTSTLLFAISRVKPRFVTNWLFHVLTAVWLVGWSRSRSWVSSSSR